jgi:luciferase family oxidoreductase group 1
MMVPLSVLDLSPITEGSDAGQALRNSLDLARHVEALGYGRFWMAEHHNLPGIASAATAVALAHVAAGTDRIRIGAGGIMLPNHAPLAIAEQFGTLAALHPGRVELGLGRAPGSDQITAHAMRRNLAGGDDFPQDVVQLIHYFQPVQPGQRVQAVPGAGLRVPIWILGSSTFGAQLAAILGLPFAFASHFAPEMMTQALALYRDNFRPSEQLATPNVMLGVNIVAAEDDEEARYLFSSLQQSFLNSRTGRPGRLPPPVIGFDTMLDRYGANIVGDALSQAIVGGPDTVRRGIEAFIERTGADELMVTANIFDHAKRKRSFEIVAEVHGGMKPNVTEQTPAASN